MKITLSQVREALKEAILDEKKKSKSKKKASSKRKSKKKPRRKKRKAKRDAGHVMSPLVVDLLRIVALERPFEKLALFLDAK